MGGESPGRGDKDECATETVTAHAFQAEAAGRVSSGGGKVGVLLRRKMGTEVHSRSLVRGEE